MSLPAVTFGTAAFKTRCFWRLLRFRLVAFQLPPRLLLKPLTSAMRPNLCAGVRQTSRDWQRSRWVTSGAHDSDSLPTYPSQLGYLHSERGKS